MTDSKDHFQALGLDPYSPSDEIPHISDVPSDEDDLVEKPKRQAGKYDSYDRDELVREIQKLEALLAASRRRNDTLLDVMKNVKP